MSTSTVADLVMLRPQVPDEQVTTRTRPGMPEKGVSVFRGPHGPVPYVAMWSAEEVQQGPLVETRQGIAYADESSVDRDHYGLLWSRVTSRQGVGEPRYRQMHPLRQRRAMNRLLCQVCAGPADHNDDGTLWLVPDQPPLWPGWPERSQTTQPPLCMRCARIAVKACPSLKPGYIAIRAHSFVSGAWGGLYRTGWPQRPPILTEACTLNLGNPSLRWLQADQLARELVGCKLADLDRPAATSPSQASCPVQGA
ncbi:hypothetical protein [Labedaea rhizosphaerae]|uniref:Uncharacterized protein n=1 Tax=Labedaea rhizosphaerae TaxID=598644 RepID=A0A4R6SF85_LABRH|nr:hypothetical protein [Labedaea rhizosphaerae]TDQ00642.1 hypothetical protein EV186_102503 [Labedaea rhizosphaerae]